MRKRIGAFILAAVLAIAAFVPAMPALADTNTSIARVYLKYLGNPKSQNFIINGYYSIAERSDIKLEIGKTYTVSYTDGTSLLLSDGTHSQKLGTRITFKQHSGGGNIKAGSRSYDGDMVVDVYGSGLRMINKVYLETYLKGVVPYEIGNSSPIEAIKAQAVAARSYALIKMKNNAAAGFDLVDDEGDQVYAGLTSASNCARAVDETKGQVLLAPDGNIAYAFYSSTNGGYTETGYYGGATTLAYYQDEKLMVNADSFDGSYSNPSTYRKTLTFPRNVSVNKLSSALTDFLHPRIANVLSSKGYKSGKADYAIVATKDVYFTSYAVQYTESDGTVRAVDRTGVPENQKLVVNIKFEITCYNIDKAIWDEVEFNIPMMFGALVQTFRPSSSVRYRMGIIQSNSSAFTLSLTRSGHGVGMSQTGAINRGNSGQTASQILSFYYPNLTQGTVNSPLPGLSGMPASQKTLAQLSGTTTPSSSEPTWIGTVNTASLNVRSGPAASYASLGVLAQGSKVLVTGVNNGWYSILYAGTTCFVSATYIKMDDTGASIPNTGSLGTGIVIDDYVLLMDQPADTAQVLYVLTKNAEVTVIEASGTWYKVTYESHTGYVPTAAILLKAAPDPTPTPTATADQYPCYGTLISNTLTFRDAPSTSGAVIGTIKKGETFYLTGKIGNWYNAQYNGKTGYLIDMYVSKGSPATLPSTQPTATPTPTPTPAPSQNSDGYASSSQAVQGTVNSSTLNLRKAPSTSSEVIKKLSKSNSVSILGETNGFYRVDYGGGLIGYASRSYISKGTKAADIWSGSSGLGKVNATNLNVRSSASVSSSALGQLKNNTLVLITGKSGQWYKIVFGSGTGYVREDYILNATPKTCTITSSSLTLRASASSASASLAVMPKGQTVYYYGKAGAWAIIGYGDKFGYAAAANVKVN